MSRCVPRSGHTVVWWTWSHRSSTPQRLWCLGVFKGAYRCFLYVYHEQSHPQCIAATCLYCWATSSLITFFICCHDCKQTQVWSFNDLNTSGAHQLFTWRHERNINMVKLLHRALLPLVESTTERQEVTLPGQLVLTKHFCQTSGVRDREVPFTLLSTFLV